MQSYHSDWYNVLQKDILHLLFFFHNCTHFQTLINPAHFLRTIPSLKNELFGVTPSSTKEENFWGSKSMMTSEAAIEHLSTCEEDLEEEESHINLGVAKEIISSNQISTATESLFTKSPVINKEFIPLLSDTSSYKQLFDVSGDEDDAVQHKNRLERVIRTCGLTKVAVEGDGNCCFRSVAVALKHLASVDQLSNIPVDVKSLSEAQLSEQLRHLAVDEWQSNKTFYQEFLVSSNIDEEAERFLQPGHFNSELGNSMVLALSNALQLPVVVLTSIPGFPILTVRPMYY